MPRRQPQNNGAEVVEVVEVETKEEAAQPPTASSSLGPVGAADGKPVADPWPLGLSRDAAWQHGNFGKYHNP